MKVSELVEQLKYKLSDPSFDKFPRELQIAYIERGYNKLLRLLNATMRTQQPEFTKSLSEHTGQSSTDGIISIQDILEVESVYVTKTGVSAQTGVSTS